MSFRDADVDLESQIPFSDSPEFDKAVDDASNELLVLNNQLVTLGKLVKNLERKNTKSQSNNLNDKCVRAIDTATNMFKQLSLSTNRLSGFQNTELNPEQIYSKDKIQREVKTSLVEFQQLQEQFTRISTELTEQAKVALNEEPRMTSGPRAVDAPRQEMILEEDVINNEEFDYQQNLIREREEEIQSIEQGVRELNEIFNDLGQIISEQGQMVDNIESNIYEVSNNTKVASNELQKALNYQRRSRRTTMCLLTLLVVVLVVVLLGVFL